MNRIITILLFITSTACCGAAPEVREIGSDSTLEEIANTENGFCIAVFESQGFFSLGPSANFFYSGAVIKLQHNLLKGEFKTTNGAYYLCSAPPEEKESLPTIGKAYLMLGKISDDRFSVKILAEPSDENLEIVMRVIRQRGLALNPPGDPLKKMVVQSEAAPSSTQAEALPDLQSVTAKKVKSTVPTVSVEPTSSIPCSVVVVLIVAALGLLWLLLKNRK